MTKVQLTAGDR